MQPSDDDLFCDLPSGVRLCYRLHGPADGQPLALVVGLGLQLTYWPASLIQALAQRGYRVLTYDNRDIGLSSQVQGAPPGPLSLLLRRAPGNPYDLSDLAADLAGLMDHLGWPAAHVAGMSMGGMIAQTLAATQPQRVLSLTSIFSTTGAFGVGRTSLSIALQFLRPPPRTEADAVARYVALCRHVSPMARSLDEAILQAQGRTAWQRGGGLAGQAGVGRQLGAILKSGDRTASLRQVRAPTLVIHGDRDPLVHPSGGLATAQAIAGAALVNIHGMGHFIGDGVSPVLVDLIHGHAQRSAAAAHAPSPVR